MARNDMEQVKYDQKVPWIKRAQNIKAMKNSKEIKAKTQKIQGCSTKKPLSAAKLLQNHADDNKSKLGFRTYFSSESLWRNKKGTDVSSQGFGFFLVVLCNLCSRLWDLWEKLNVRLIISHENDCPVLWNFLVRVEFIFMFCRSLSLSTYSSVEFIVLLQVCNLMFHPPAGKCLIHIFCVQRFSCVHAVCNAFCKTFLFFPLDFCNFSVVFKCSSMKSSKLLFLVIGACEWTCSGTK